MARKTKFAAAMDKKGVRPDDLAYKSGLSLGYIYKLRRGEQTPSLQTARLLADLIGEPITIFLDSDCPGETCEDSKEVASCPA